jgi:hypothetical protein
MFLIAARYPETDICWHLLKAAEFVPGGGWDEISA